jgi:molybdopterin molybdotransferase
MDGFAALASAAGSELRIVGESRAGSPADLTPGVGEAIAISTGALAPPGVGVAPIETVSLADGTVTLHSDLEAGDHVRRAGEDLPTGATALTAGTVIEAGHLSVAASCGLRLLPCVAKPRVAIVVTGDELVDGGQQLGPGQIHESNGVTLAALCDGAGSTVKSVTRATDSLDSTRGALSLALRECDIVIVSGGISVGRHDHVRPALAELGVEERFAGVALKPGGPTWFGVLPDGPLVFGLPGNPASAFVTFALFVAPAIRSMLGTDPIPGRWPAVLADSVRLGPREQAIRVTLEPTDDGLPVARSTGAQGSHRTASLSGAWGLAMVQQGDGSLPAGSQVLVEPL